MDACHIRPARAVAHPREHALDRFRLTLIHVLDRALGVVAHPSSDTQDRGLVVPALSISDSLHASRDDHAATDRHRGEARTGRPGSASGTSSPSRTTKVPPTMTWAMPDD